MERKLKSVRFLQKFCGLVVRDFENYSREDVRNLYDFINNSEVSAKTKKSNKLKVRRAFDGHRMYDTQHIILSAAEKAPPKLHLPTFQVNLLLQL